MSGDDGVGDFFWGGEAFEGCAIDLGLDVGGVETVGVVTEYPAGRDGEDADVGG